MSASARSQMRRSADKNTTQQGIQRANDATALSATPQLHASTDARALCRPSLTENFVGLGDLKLPNRQTLGTFSYVDQIVRLDGFNSKDVYATLPGDSLKTRLLRLHSLYRTAYHEYTHFLDLTTTTYGLTLVNKLVTAAAHYSRRGIQADPLSPAPVSLRSEFEEVDRERMHAWHKEGKWPQPWGFRPYYGNARTSAGSVEQYLLIGAAFFNPATAVDFACAPFSVPAMLESNAVVNELFLASIFSRTETFRNIDTTQLLSSLTSDTLKFFYDPDFLEYTVCFHRCANLTLIPDIVHAGHIMALIIRICLDVPLEIMVEYFPSAGSLDGIRPDVRERVLGNIRAGSRSAVFELLTSVLVPADAGITPAEVVQRAMKKTNLGYSEEGAAEAKNFLLRAILKAARGLPTWDPLAKIIEQNVKVAYDFDGLYRIADYTLPNCVLSDGQLFHPHKPTPNSPMHASVANFDCVEHATWMGNFFEWFTGR